MIIKYSQILEKNGKTIKENNLEKIHNIPIGTIVETSFEECTKDYKTGRETLVKISGQFYVQSHTRDCDGTPLYSISIKPIGYMEDDGYTFINNIVKHAICGIRHGFSEESLKPIE